MNTEQKQKTLNDFYKNSIYTFIEEIINGSIIAHHGFVTRPLSETSYLVTFFDIERKREMPIILDVIRYISISDYKKIPEKEAREIFEEWRGER